MSSTVTRPSEHVAANRRRAFMWAPLLLAGVLVSLVGGPMITVFNGLDLVGAAMMLGALAGFVRELDK